MYFSNTQCLYEEAQAALTSFMLALEMIFLLKATNCDTKLVCNHHDMISSDNSLKNACQTLSSRILRELIYLQATFVF